MLPSPYPDMYLIILRQFQERQIIVTTNIPFGTMQKAQDIGDRRIYDRILEVCVPVRFDGENFRKDNAKQTVQKAARLLQSVSC